MRQALNTSPVNADGKLIPKAVPEVVHPVLVVPAGSIKNRGLVEVLVPPVKMEPFRVIPGVEAAPAAVKILGAASNAANPVPSASAAPWALRVNFRSAPPWVP